MLLRNNRTHPITAFNTITAPGLKSLHTIEVKGGSCSVACTVASTHLDDSGSSPTTYHGRKDPVRDNFIRQLCSSVRRTHIIITNKRIGNNVDSLQKYCDEVAIPPSMDLITIYKSFKNISTFITSKYDKCTNISNDEEMIYKSIFFGTNRRIKHYMRRKLKMFTHAFQMSAFKRFMPMTLPNEILQYEKSNYGAELSISHRTDQVVLDYIRGKSKDFFKHFKLPNVIINTSTKACFEGSNNYSYLYHQNHVPSNPIELGEYIHQQNLMTDQAIRKSLHNNTSVRHIQVVEPLKVRNLTAMPAHHQVLKEYQKAIKAWIDKDPSFKLTNSPDIKSAVQSMNWPKDLLFTSGDYSSATDTIHRDVVLASISGINSRLLESSFDNYSVFDKEGNLLINQRNGQLMGSLISFPILCLINKWIYEYTQDTSSEQSTVPLINGDDILFKSTRLFHDQWRNNIKLVGFRPSPGKNFLNASHFTINSRPFSYDGEYHQLRFVNGKYFKVHVNLYEYSKYVNLIDIGKNIKDRIHFLRDLGLKLSTTSFTKRMTKYIHKDSPLELGGCALICNDKLTALKKAYQYVHINREEQPKNLFLEYLDRHHYPSLFNVKESQNHFETKGISQYLHRKQFQMPTYCHVIHNKRPYTYSGYSIFSEPHELEMCAVNTPQKEKY